MSELVPREKRFDHGKQDHDEMIEFGLLDDEQPTEYAHFLSTQGRLWQSLSQSVKVERGNP